MVRPLLEAALVAVPAFPHPVHGMNGLVMMRDDIVRAKEYVQFERIDVLGVVPVKGDGVQNQIEIIPPIVHFGNV
ncbi:MAG: hypothetical protein A2139_01750 [Desulfobacca sp. RBG_16_60_12]|nr:MAG: hypothetical protein A2139_01750 [Desulfobacca sp. RBG_16_60_12]